MACPPSSSASSWSSGAPTLCSSFRKNTSPWRACASACGLTLRKVSGASCGEGLCLIFTIVIITVVTFVRDIALDIFILLSSFFVLKLYNRSPYHDYNLFNYYYQCYPYNYYYNPIGILLTDVINRHTHEIHRKYR